MAETGLRQRHGNQCPQTGTCKCPWEASVYSPRDGKKIRKQFPTKSAAKNWRDDARGQVRQRKMRAPVPITLAEAADRWLEGARRGIYTNRSGDAYKPSAIRAYEAGLRLRVLPEFGRMRLDVITRSDVQRFVNQMNAEGLNPSTVQVTLLPLRAIFKEALSDGFEEIPEGVFTVNPTTGLKLKAVRGRRDRIASPEECAQLLEALPERDRPLWATAMYAGLRRGELQALRLEDVDLATGKIHVCRGWDAKEGEIEVKSRKPRRVPIAAVLRDYLDQHLIALPWEEGLVFGSTPSDAFASNSAAQRAMAAWGWKRNRPAGDQGAWTKERDDAIEPISLHECRHTFASLMIAAGVNAKALSTYMGHANISITLDLYGHLMPGNEKEAAALLDTYLARASEDAARASLAPVEV